MLQRCNERIAQLEALEAELAEAKATIARVKEVAEDRYCYDAGDTHDRTDAAINELIGDFRAVLSPKPTDNSEDAT